MTHYRTCKGLTANITPATQTLRTLLPINIAPFEAVYAPFLSELIPNYIVIDEFVAAANHTLHFISTASKT
jgi:hypothetical protein